MGECFTSYKVSTLLPNEHHDTPRDAFCIDMRSATIGRPPCCNILADPALCFVTLDNYPVFHDHRIVLEIGIVKNRNKNPAAERAIQELELELLRQDPHGGPVSSVVLSFGTSGSSAHKMWTQRDHFSNIHIPLSDDDLISQQHKLRKVNHPSSQKSKGPLAEVDRSLLIALVTWCISIVKKTNRIGEIAT